MDEHGTPPFPPPRLERSRVVVAPPGEGAGYWAGAPSACLVDGVDLPRLPAARRPIGQGRGYAVAVARSADGERFETLATIARHEMDAESLERPALVRTPDGRWRLYLSCATPGTKHWRVELIEATDPAGSTSRTRQIVLPGDAKTGVKDPVIVHHDGRWHLWASCHPLDDPLQTDQMTTEYATSADGVDVDVARHRAERDAGPVGLARRTRSPRCASTGDAVTRLVRRAGQRRGELRGADRDRHRRRVRAVRPSGGPAGGRVTVRRPALPVRGPAAGRRVAACTTRRPARTGRTSSAPSWHSGVGVDA